MLAPLSRLFRRMLNATSRNFVSVSLSFRQWLSLGCIEIASPALRAGSQRRFFIIVHSKLNLCLTFSLVPDHADQGSATTPSCVVAGPRPAYPITPIRRSPERLGKIQGRTRDLGCGPLHTIDQSTNYLSNSNFFVSLNVVPSSATAVMR